MRKIGARLLGALPPTKIHFRFVLIDSPEVNGISLAAGGAYISRENWWRAHAAKTKLPVCWRTRSSLVPHQSAAEISDGMHRLMGITSIGDKADVYEKFRRLMDAERNDKKRREDPDSDPNQNQADRVAVYAMAVAGYQPQSYAEFWDRSFFVQGKTGGALSDFFGMTKRTQKRLRQLRQLVAELPKGCGPATTSETAEFHQWQNAVTANQKSAAMTEAKSTVEKTIDLKQPLRMDLQRVRFSRDGKYLFAQDESSISVLERDPLQVLFRFDADDAKPAEWSPDSAKIRSSTPQAFTSRSGVSPSGNCSRHMKSS